MQPIHLKYRPVRIALSLLVMALVAVSCSDDNPTTEQAKDVTLVSSKLVYSVPAQQVQLLALLSLPNIDVSKFVNTVDVYTVTYNTTYKGANIVASGLVALPTSKSEFPMISYQHGTILTDAEAPSNFSVEKAETLVSVTLASAGLITVIPDYLGFGSSVSMLHPYFVEDLYASAVTDMLKAAKELAAHKKITFSGKLFLAGYSEGGYATMATHKSIETNGLDGFELVASFPGAGAYDLQALQQTLLTSEDYDDPFYLAYIALAYQTTYSFPSLLTDFFQEPYAGRIPALFDHQTVSTEINSQLTTNIADLTQPNLAANILNNASFAYIKTAFQNNSLTDWTPKKKMFMYHGTSDTTVPFQNSVATFDALKANGASDDIISLTPLPGDHSSAVTPYVADLLVKLFSLK
ncbi:MAG: prolyl oligopeptidase family serine peptidase [Chryseolinea sp.]